uniref:Uncharacterized protein n=1 Tax=Anguilla anguilla TaxID=7936 RepID=A0A0E9VI52_ANGAN
MWRCVFCTLLCTLLSS